MLTADFICILKPWKAMLIRTFLTVAILTSCFSHDKRENEFSSDPKKKVFEKKLGNMSAAEVDTTYAKICRNLDKQRSKLNIEYKSANTDDAKEKILVRARSLLFSYLTDSIFVCWYGTDWDFNGVTTCPRQGSIACGYFVSTILKQAGFNCDRTFLAQQASSVMIKTFCSDDKVKIVTNHKQDKLFEWLSAQPDGIFMLGLDKHTGFVVKQGNLFDFVHSSFWPQDKVVRVPLKTSEIFNESNYYMLGELLYSDSTMTKWIKGDLITN